MTTIAENLKLFNNKASICTKHFSPIPEESGIPRRCVYCGELF